MRIRQLLHSRTGAVVVGAMVLVGLGGASGAFAATMVTSANIQDDTIRSRDVHDGTLGMRDMNSYTTDKINQPAAAKYVGKNWSIIDRNTIGNGDAFLRAGPSSKAFGESADQAAPPIGIGSLGIRTGSAQDKADFGDAVDFVGDSVSGLQTLKYSVFTTGENNGAGVANLPNLTYEINPHLDNNGTPVTYTSMVYVPAAQSAGWAEHDASEPTTNNNTSGWYFTGTAGNLTGCTQAKLCTLTEAQAAVPDGTVYTVAISKGRDAAFSGAVDKLVINNATYDFEPLGVIKTTN